MTADDLKTMLPSPIAFNRAFAVIAGGTAGGVFLAQCFYWLQHTETDRDGWFYKSGKDWEYETGMKRREQEAARKALRDNGVLQERQGSSTNRSVWYRIDLTVLGDLVQQVMNASPCVQNVHMEEADCTHASAQGVPMEVYESALSNGTNRTHVTENTAETTPEITTQTTAEITFLSATDETAVEGAETQEWGSRDDAPPVVKNKTTGTKKPSKKAAQEKPEKQAKSVLIPCPADFAPTEENRAWALSQCAELDLDALTEEFVNYWVNGPGHSGRRIEWQLTWKVRVRQVIASGRFRKQSAPFRSGYGGYGSVPLQPEVPLYTPQKGDPLAGKVIYSPRTGTTTTLPNDGGGGGTPVTASSRPLNRYEQRVAEGEARIQQQRREALAQIDALEASLDEGAVLTGPFFGKVRN